MTQRFPKHLVRPVAICGIFALPIAGAVGASITDSGRAIARIEREQLGLAASIQANAALADVERYRIAALDAGPAARNASTVAAAGLHRALEALTRSDLRAVSDAGPRTHLAAIRAHRRTILGAATQADRVTATVPAAEALLTLMLDIQDASGLTYDQTIDGINLSDALLARLPSGRERRDQSAQIVEFAARRDRIRPREIIAAEVPFGEARNAAAAALDDFTGAALVAPDLERRLRAEWVAGIAADAALADAINARVLDRGAERPRMLSTLRRGAVDAGERLFGSVALALGDSLDARIAARHRSIALALALGVLALVASFGLVAALWQALRRRDRLELARANERARGLETALARRDAERALHLTEQQFRAVFDGSPVGIAIVTRGGERLDTNAAFDTMFAADAAAVGIVARRMFAQLEAGGERAAHMEHRFEIPGRPVLWAQVSLSPIRPATGGPITAIVMVHDITEHKTLHQRLDHQTLHDALTKLPNRTFFMRRLEATLRDPAGRFAVVFIDLDGFKSVNDALGHHAGDRLLRVAAQRLTEAVRACDFVARLHGDEFALILAELPDSGTGEIDVVTARLAHMLRLPLEGPGIVVTASIGVVRSSATQRDPELYLRDADAAMYRSKLRGGACITLAGAEGGASADIVREAIDMPGRMTHRGNAPSIKHTGTVPSESLRS